MEWKNAVLNKEEFQKKQQEYIHQAMQMAKRSKSLSDEIIPVIENENLGNEVYKEKSEALYNETKSFELEADNEKDETLYDEQSEPFETLQNESKSFEIETDSVNDESLYVEQPMDVETLENDESVENQSELESKETPSDDDLVLLELDEEEKPTRFMKENTTTKSPNHHSQNPNQRFGNRYANPTRPQARQTPPHQKNTQPADQDSKKK